MGVAAYATTGDEERWTASVATASTARMEKKEDEERRVKKFPFSKPKGVVFPFSKPKGVFLENENIFFQGKKENDHRLLGEEVG